MDQIEAHERLAYRDNRDVLPLEFLVENSYGELFDVWPAAATALAIHSGWLDDAKTDEDLDEAVLHGWTLVESGILPKGEFFDATKRVVAAILQWGDEICSVG